MRAEAIWRGLAEKAFGQPLDAGRSVTSDGLTIEPLYGRQAEDRPRPWRRGAWSVAARIDHPEGEEANRLALLDLVGGADALTLVFEESPFARGFGLASGASAEALSGVELDFISLRVDAGAATPAVAEDIAALVGRRGLGGAGLAIDLCYDPIGLLAVGHPDMGRQDVGRQDMADPLDIVRTSRAAGLAGRPLLADGRPYHEAGAGAAMELAAVVATGVAYLRRLERDGLSLDESRRSLAFLLAVDADVFQGLAKVRAIRRLWARIEAASGLTPEPIRLHAETAWRMMARRDPWTNVMRATAAAFSAGVGGADVLTVLPFTLALGLPDEAARRLARNVQRVLIDEANLAMVDDPAAGSGGLDALTDGLCERAWLFFKEIEREGGIEAALRGGTIAKRIADVARTRTADIASLRAGIVGSTLYPSLTTPAPGVLPHEPRRPPARPTSALPSVRDAEPFEALRERADLAATRPSVFLVTLGEPAAYGARVTEAINTLAAGGLEAVFDRDARTVSDAQKDFRDSGRRVVCLCGSDRAYADEPDLAQALRAMGATLILRSGGPPAAHDGVDHVIRPGCDALGILAAALEMAARDDQPSM